MGGKVVHDIVAPRLHLYGDSRQVEDVGFQNGQFLAGEVLFDRDGPEAVARRFPGQLFKDILAVQVDEPVHALRQIFAVFDFFGYHEEVKRGAVVDQDLPVTIEDHSPEGEEVQKLNPVAFGFYPVLGALHNLQQPEP